MAQNRQEPYLTEEAAERLKQQIEFYFSDANLVSDQTFFKEAEYNCWVDISYILKCRKVKGMLEKLRVCHRSKKRIIASVLKNSSLLKVHKTKVRRRKPFNKRGKNPSFLYLEA